MTTHHRHSPSSLELYEACPKFEKQEWTDTTASDEGTMMHAVLETGDRRLLETVEQEEQINKCFSILHDLRLEMGNDHEVGHEVLLYVASETGDPLTQGTTDLTIVSKDRKRAVVLDWKMGITPISPAETNLQLQCYVCGLLQKYPSIETVEGVMVAPRQDFYSRHQYVRDDIPSIVARIQGAIDKREDPFAQPTCDETACGLCAHKSRCPALLGTALTVFQGTGILPHPTEFSLDRIVTPLDRARAHVLAKILEDWAAEVKRYNTQAVYEGGEPIPPGFALRKRQGGYGIDSSFLPEVLGHIKEKYGIDTSDEELLACFSLSASKLGTLLSDRTGKDKRDLLQILQEAVPDGVMERSPVVYLQKKSKKITDEQILLGDINENE